MNRDPITNWDDVPLVADIVTAARVLNTSVSSIKRRCQAGTMVPAPMPKVGKTSAYRWAKRALIEFVDERGYEKHDTQRRRFFQRASA